MTEGDGENSGDRLFLMQIEEEAGPEVAAEVASALKNGTPPSSLPEEVKTDEGDNVPEAKTTDMRAMIAKMSMAEKIKTAMFGNATCRKLLILDPARMIQECVLNNPKMMPPEIEDIARNTNVDAQVLRSIAQRQSWMKTYRVKANLVLNPKCPPDLSLKWLRFLNLSDVKNIARSKNVPQVLQLSAKKRLEAEAK